MNIWDLGIVRIKYNLHVMHFVKADLKTGLSNLIVINDYVVEQYICPIVKLAEVW